MHDGTILALHHLAANLFIQKFVNNRFTVEATRCRTRTAWLTVPKSLNHLLSKLLHITSALTFDSYHGPRQELILFGLRRWLYRKGLDGKRVSRPMVGSVASLATASGNT